MRQKIVLFATLVLLSGVVLVGRSAFATHLQEDKSYTIKRIYTKGEVKYFKLGATLVMGDAGKDMQYKIGLYIKDATKQVKEDGGAVVRMEFPKGTADIGMGNLEIPAGFIPSLLMTLDKDNHVVRVEKEGEGIGGISPEKMIALAMVGFYPQKPVKVGDSWDIEIEDPDNKGKVKKVGTATLRGIEKQKGVDTFKVTWKAEMVRKEGNKERKAHVDAVANVDMKSGRTVLLKGKTEGELEQNIKKADVTFELLSEKEVEALEKEK
jgi:hypothetical protein